MSERTYPRKWFRVSHFGGGIKEREVKRETEKMLFFDSYRGERRAAKQNSYDRWYPTREEAEQALAVVEQRRAERDRIQRMRNASPEMVGLLWNTLDTLERLRADLAEENAELHAQRIAVIDNDIAAIRVLLSRIEGEQP